MAHRDHLVDLVVLGDEDPQALSRCRAPDVPTGGRVENGRWRGLGEMDATASRGARRADHRRAAQRHGLIRDREREGAACPWDARRADLASEQLDEFAADRQAETAATILAGRRGIGLDEGIEYARGDVLLHPDAAVGDLEAKPARACGRLGRAHAHLALRCELDGVGEKVREDLAKSVSVASDDARHTRVNREDDLEVLARRDARDHPDGVLEHPAGIELERVEPQLAGFELREVEYVVDEMHQGVARVAYDVDVLPLGLVEVGLEQHLAHPQQPVQRGPDLVADVGHELGLQARGGIGGGLGPLTLGDVTNRSRDGGPHGGPHRAEADLDGELAAVSPPGIELAAVAHRTLVGAPAELLALQAMGRA